MRGGPSILGRAILAAVAAKIWAMAAFSCAVESQRRNDYSKSREHPISIGALPPIPMLFVRGLSADAEPRAFLRFGVREKRGMHMNWMNVGKGLPAACMIVGEVAVALRGAYIGAATGRNSASRARGRRLALS